MSDRTPPTGTVKAAFAEAHPFPLTTDLEERYAEFDRWLSQVRAEAKSEHFREAAEEVRSSAQASAALQRAHDAAEGIKPLGTSTPNEVGWHQMGNWAHSTLRALADQIEMEARRG